MYTQRETEVGVTVRRNWGRGHIRETLAGITPSGEGEGKRWLVSKALARVISEYWRGSHTKMKHRLKSHGDGGGGVTYSKEAPAGVTGGWGKRTVRILVGVTESGVGVG